MTTYVVTKSRDVIVSEQYVESTHVDEAAAQAAAGADGVVIAVQGDLLSNDDGVYKFSTGLIIRRAW